MRLLASLLAALTVTTDAFSPASRSRVLNDLREMRMTGAGGAATPDYVEGGKLPAALQNDVGTTAALATRRLPYSRPIC